MSNIRTCEVCGKSGDKIRVSFWKEFNRVLCCNHYTQLKRMGRISKRIMYVKNEIIKYKDYAEIILYNIKGEERARAKIDLEDIVKCEEFRWCVGSSNYVYTKSSNGISMHRYLLKPPKKVLIDHINHNTLDNRKCNLRLVTPQQNQFNNELSKNNTSGFTGVRFNKSCGLWTASIRVDKKAKFLGYFKDKEKAVEARKKGEVKFFGEYRYKEEI